MANAQSSSDPDLSKNYFDRLLAIQSSVKELQVEFNQLMKDAEVDGLDRKALDTLVKMVAAETKPRSEKLFNTMIEYGNAAGYQLNIFSDAEQPIYKSKVESTHSVPNQSSNTQFSTQRRLIGNKVTILLQAIIGLAAGSTLVWLLH